MKPKGDDTVGSLQKAMDMLDALASEPYEYKADELAEKLGYNRTTTYRTLQVMQKQGAVIQDPVTKKYMIGSWLRRVGGAARRAYPFETQARALINELGFTLGHSVGMAIVDNGEFYSFIETALTGPDMLNEAEGKPCSPNAGAYGKCLMAYQTEEFMDAYFATHPLRQVAPNVITDIPALKAEYALIRERGWSFSVGETLIDHASVGVPLFDHSGKIFGCLVSVAVLKDGWEAEIDRIRAALLDAKPALEALLP